MRGLLVLAFLFMLASGGGHQAASPAGPPAVTSCAGAASVPGYPCYRH